MTTKTNPRWSKYKYFKIKTESNMCETSTRQVRQGSIKCRLEPLDIYIGGN